MSFKGFKHSAETRRKMSEAQQNMSDETKRKISESHKGKKLSVEHRRKIGLGNNGRKHSADTRRKISEAQKGKKLTLEHKKKLSLAHKNPSSETRQKLSIARKRRKTSAETRRKLSLANKNPSLETRRKISEAVKNPSLETRQKMSESHKGQKRSADARKKMSIAAIKRVCNNPQKDKFSNTKPERELKEIFTKNNIKFTHQYFMEDIQHPYAADFYLPDYNCIVEADGVYWHHHPHGNDIDHIRTKEMKDKGFNVLRFWEGQIAEEDVMQRLGELV